MCRCILLNDVVCDALLVMLFYIILYCLMYASMVCYVVVLNTVLILCIECIVCRICCDMFLNKHQQYIAHRMVVVCYCVILRPLLFVCYRQDLKKKLAKEELTHKTLVRALQKNSTGHAEERMKHGFLVHPGRLTWNRLIGGLVQIIFLSKWVICRFHINLPGCKRKLARYSEYTPKA